MLAKKQNKTYFTFKKFLENFYDIQSVTDNFKSCTKY